MSNLDAPVVYLDVQDYSRFGDVLRGKSDASTEQLFLDLEKQASAGRVIFPVSMPVLGELLQYDANFRDTTIHKAEAVERLCGPWALPFPTRLVAAEIVETARARGDIPSGDPIALLSSERYWYPNVSVEFGGLRDELRRVANEQLAAAQLPSRQLRRRAKRFARTVDLAAVAEAAAPEAAEKFGLPQSAVTESFVALLRGRVTPEVASRRLFQTIAEPVRFVELYFERLETDRSLPDWMKKAGADFQALFIRLREDLQPLLVGDFGQVIRKEMFEYWPVSAGKAVLKMGYEDCREFGIDPLLVPVLVDNEGFAESVPAARITGMLIAAYARQVVGLSATGAKIEHSFGGDLVHALYLPHVDLWRGDRRFSALIADAMPGYASRVVSKLAALPAAIDDWHSKQERVRSVLP